MSPAPPTPARPRLSAAHWQHYPSYNDIQDLAFAPDGTLWAAVMGGVVQWDLSTDTPTYHILPGGKYVHVIHQIAITPDNIVWGATSSGIARFDGVTWRTFTIADGLPTDIIYTLRGCLEIASKDYEHCTKSSAGMIYAASIVAMLKRLEKI